MAQPTLAYRPDLTSHSAVAAAALDKAVEEYNTAFAEAKQTVAETGSLKDKFYNDFHGRLTLYTSAQRLSAKDASLHGGLSVCPTTEEVEAEFMAGAKALRQLDGQFAAFREVVIKLEEARVELEKAIQKDEATLLAHNKTLADNVGRTFNPDPKSYDEELKKFGEEKDRASRLLSSSQMYLEQAAQLSARMYDGRSGRVPEACSELSKIFNMFSNPSSYTVVSGEGDSAVSTEHKVLVPWLRNMAAVYSSYKSLTLEQIVDEHNRRGGKLGNEAEAGVEVKEVKKEDVVPPPSSVPASSGDIETDGSNGGDTPPPVIPVSNEADDKSGKKNANPVDQTVETA